MLTLILVLMNYLCRLSSDGQEFFTSYDEVHDSFDVMGFQENLLRGIYAYGRYMALFPFCEEFKALLVSWIPLAQIKGKLIWDVQKGIVNY